jgi:ATP-binding protein involved in chromosome partitioning
MAGMTAATVVTEEQIRSALARVQDPEIRRPITEIGMVKSVAVDAAGAANVAIYLTVAGCPLKDKLRSDITAEVGALDGITSVAVEMDVMSPEQRQELQAVLRGGRTSGRSRSPSPARSPGCSRWPRARAGSARAR